MIIYRLITSEVLTKFFKIYFKNLPFPFGKLEITWFPNKGGHFFYHIPGISLCNCRHSTCCFLKTMLFYLFKTMLLKKKKEKKSCWKPSNSFPTQGRWSELCLDFRSSQETGYLGWQDQRMEVKTPDSENRGGTREFGTWGIYPPSKANI